jgi:hypothetical protein
MVAIVGTIGGVLIAYALYLCGRDLVQWRQVSRETNRKMGGAVSILGAFAMLVGMVTLALTQSVTGSIIFALGTIAYFAGGWLMQEGKYRFELVRGHEAIKPVVKHNFFMRGVEPRYPKP